MFVWLRACIVKTQKCPPLRFVLAIIIFPISVVESTTLVGLVVAQIYLLYISMLKIENFLWQGERGAQEKFDEMMQICTKITVPTTLGQENVGFVRAVIFKPIPYGWFFKKIIKKLGLGLYLIYDSSLMRRLDYTLPVKLDPLLVHFIFPMEIDT
ncbi:hypothetical protein ACJX0J_031715 [Zea mays]